MTHCNFFSYKFVTDNVKKSSVSCTVLTCSKQIMRNKEEEDISKSIDVVPVKYSLKVKLESVHNSRVPKLE